MHPFNADFYGHEMKAIVLGYIRPELDYTSRGIYQRWFSDDDQFLTRPPFSSHLTTYPHFR
jgi:FAD synthase